MYSNDNRRLAKDLRVFNQQLNRGAKASGDVKPVAGKAMRP